MHMVIQMWDESSNYSTLAQEYQSIDISIIWVHMYILHSIGLTASRSRMRFHDLRIKPTVACEVLPELVPSQPHLALL